MKHYLLCIVLYFLNFLASSGQHNLLRFSHISSKEGLPHSLVFSFAQDSLGFIWMGTNNGLARYDGYNFRVFQPDPTKSNSISDKSVFLVHCDKKGYLWMYLQGKGLNRMELRTEQFRQYYPDKDKPGAISGNEIKQIVEDDEGSLWFATNNGIDKYSPVTDNFMHYLPAQVDPKSSPSNNVSKMVIDKNKNVWFLSSRGIGFLNSKTREVTSIGKLTSQQWSDSVYYYDIKIDREGDLWYCGAYGGLFHYNIKTNTLTQQLRNYSNLRYLYIDRNDNLYVYADRPVNHLLVLEKKNRAQMKFSEYPMFSTQNAIDYFSFSEDRNNNIWITSTQGLECINPDAGLFHYRANIHFPGSLSGNNLVTGFIDRSENLWLSVYRLGVDKADLLQKPFRWYLSNLENSDNSIPGNDITAVYEDRRGNIWIGTFGTGLTCYNPKLGTYRTIPVRIDDKSKINFNAPSAMYEDDQGRLWVGYHDGQLDRINPATFQIERFRDNVPKSSPYYFAAWGIREILPDKEGNLWIASTSRGVIELNKKTGSFVYHSFLYEKDYASNSFYRTAFVDKDNNVWAGTQNGGLIRYERNNNRFTSYKHNKDDNYSISNNTVYAIYEDSTAMWVGTAGGLNRFDKRTSKFYKFKALKALNTYAIYSIYADKQRNLWMSTDHGILSFNPETETLRNYIDSDGLPANEFSTTGHAQLRSGEIFLGTAKGLVSFLPSEIGENPYKAKPIITDFRIFNKSIAPGDSLHGRAILKEHIWATKKLVIKHNENDFSIEFSALHYAAPDKIIYYYKLENFNDNWLTTDSKRRFASYTGIQPGKYIFRLKTVNSDGVNSDPSDEVTLEIYIAPPFWKTWVFRITLGLLIVLGIAFYIRQRLRGFKNQKIKLERMVRQRTRDLEAINVMLEEKQEEINIQHEELLSQKDHLEIANVKLTEQQNKIIEQNLELHKHRNHLEQLIQERTAELLDAKLKAEESDKLKSSFISNLSHEIRTPMNAIVGFSSLLRDNHFTEEELRGIYNIIISNGESLLVLINDILDLSFIEAGQMRLKNSRCNLKDFLLEIYATHLPVASNKRIELKLAINSLPESFVVQADVVRLRQVLDNLVGNAIKFTNTGDVTFGIKSIDKEILFFVSDTGIGISGDIGNKIFDRFIKIEDNPDAVFRGTGLGLAISKSIVELWRGEIWYESQVKVGTTFYFSYPINWGSDDKSFKGTENSQSKHDSASVLRDKVVLVAEDEAFNYQVIAAYFKGTGAILHWVKNGQEAVDFVRNKRPDIILMDIKMPVLNGKAATTIIKEENPSIMIIAQTAYARQEEIDEFLQAGFDGYIVKPYRKEDLLAIVQKFVC